MSRQGLPTQPSLYLLLGNTISTDVKNIERSWFGKENYSFRRKRLPRKGIGKNIFDIILALMIYRFPCLNFKIIVSISAHITQWIKQGTEIWSDMWRAYNNIPALGFQHGFVNHTL
jgi:hypothetical protein